MDGNSSFITIYSASETSKGKLSVSFLICHLLSTWQTRTTVIWVTCTVFVSDCCRFRGGEGVRKCTEIHTTTSSSGSKKKKKEWKNLGLSNILLRWDYSRYWPPLAADVQSRCKSLLMWHIASCVPWAQAREITAAMKGDQTAEHGALCWCTVCTHAGWDGSFSNSLCLQS